MSDIQAARGRQASERSLAHRAVVIFAFRDLRAAHVRTLAALIAEEIAAAPSRRHARYRRRTVDV